MELWVVGRIESDETYRQWELVGVFDTEEQALEVCRTENHFLGSVILNEDAGDEPEQFPNTRYPLREKKEDS